MDTPFTAERHSAITPATHVDVCAALKSIDQKPVGVVAGHAISQSEP